jgi:hypothetical protein
MFACRIDLMTTINVINVKEILVMSKIIKIIGRIVKLVLSIHELHFISVELTNEDQEIEPNDELILFIIVVLLLIL